MQATIKKWGNSPALRLSASLMQLAQLSLNQEVNIQVLKGKLVIEPASPKEYSLESLVGGITAQNCHAEIDCGPSVSMEAF
jgi:antitoxin MazE